MNKEAQVLHYMLEKAIQIRWRRRTSGMNFWMGVVFLGCVDKERGRGKMTHCYTCNWEGGFRLFFDYIFCGFFF